MTGTYEHSIDNAGRLIVPSKLRDKLVRQIFSHTTTNGLRARLSEKYFLKPSQGRARTQWGPVGVKIAEGFGVTHAKPEFEDVAALAREHGLSYETVFQAAMKEIGNL